MTITSRNVRLAVVLMAALLGLAVVAPPVTATTGDLVSVVVREVPGTGDAPERAVAQLGGSVTQQYEIIDGFAALVPAGAVDLLAGRRDVAAVTPNATVRLEAAGWEDATSLGNYNPNTFDGSMYRVAQSVVKADEYWKAGYTGAGIDIALIDSGVVPVEGLVQPGKVINGPDLSFESQADNLRYLDTFGHGTHMAGIIAGRDTDTPITNLNTDAFLGIAPGSRIVNIKVADSNGATDVSQVLAAIDWVVQHRTDNGMNIRVVNLSFGTDGNQSYVLDPLAFAVEQAWKSGIVVVVAAGNDGNSFALRNPASDPYVIAVGASESAKTRTKISSVMDFSNCGTADRYVDVVVPGKSIVSLRSPGSYADVNYPQCPGGRSPLPRLRYQPIGRRRIRDGCAHPQRAAERHAGSSEGPVDGFDAHPQESLDRVPGSGCAGPRQDHERRHSPDRPTIRTLNRHRQPRGRPGQQPRRRQRYCSGRRAGHLRNGMGWRFVVGSGGGKCVVVGWRLEWFYLDRRFVEQRFVEWCFLVERFVVGGVVVRGFVE